MIYLGTGAIVAGKLTVDAREGMLDALVEWSDGPVTITIEQQKSTRSQQANAYYWAVVVKGLAAYNGNTPDEVHEVLKLKFLSKELAFANGNGEVVAEFVIGGSTRQLDTAAFYDYVERIRAWSLEALELPIPPPDPLWRQEIEDETR